MEQEIIFENDILVASEVFIDDNHPGKSVDLETEYEVNANVGQYFFNEHDYAKKVENLELGASSGVANSNCGSDDGTARILANIIGPGDSPFFVLSGNERASNKGMFSDEYESDQSDLDNKYFLGGEVEIPTEFDLDESKQISDGVTSSLSALYDIYKADIHRAAKSGDHDSVEAYIHNGDDINKLDEKGCTALYYACENGHYEVASTLMNKNANAVLGELPLLAAIRKNHRYCIKVLLRHQVDVNATSVDGKSAFHIACEMNKTGIAELLLEGGANVDKEIKALSLLKGSSHFLMRLLYFSAKNNWSDVIDLLLGQFGLDVNCVSKRKTALIGAAENGHINMMDKLIACGSQLEIKKSDDSEGCFDESKSEYYTDYNTIQTTPLHAACQNGHVDAVKFLLDKGCDIDCVDEGGRTPLFSAALAGKSDIVEMLICSGADINHKDDNGTNALLYVCSQEENMVDYGDVVRILLRNGIETGTDFDCSGLVSAAQHNHHTIVEALLESGLDPDQRDYSGTTALLVACEKGREKIVEVLLAHKAKVNKLEYPQQKTDHYSRFYAEQIPLCVSTKNGHSTITKMLLDNGACVNVLDSKGMTPVAYAVDYFCSEMKVNEIADIACQFESRLQLIKMLLDFGADTSLCASEDNDNFCDLVFGLTNAKLPIHIAIKNSHAAKIGKRLHKLAIQLKLIMRMDNDVLKQLSFDFLNSRIDLLKLLVDCGSMMDHRRSYKRNFHPQNFLVSMDNTRSLLVYLFKAGASVNLLSWACETLSVGSFEKEDSSNSPNLFKALVLNGLKLEEHEEYELEQEDGADDVAIWQLQTRSTPLSLLQLSRIAIRNQMSTATESRSILPSVEELPLPEQLKLYLKFEGMYNEVDLDTPIDPESWWKEIISSFTRNTSSSIFDILDLVFGVNGNDSDDDLDDDYFMDYSSSEYYYSSYDSDDGMMDSDQYDGSYDGYSESDNF